MSSRNEADLDLLICSHNQWPDLGRYEVLDNDKSEIRLLSFCQKDVNGKIAASTTHAKLDSDTPEYEALSYCWGPPGRLETIEVNGLIVHVRASLHSFLKVYCQSQPSRLLWIDAICINQRDVLERNSQVAMMGKIYRSAKRVVSWLGEGDAYTDFAITYVHHRHHQAVRDTKNHRKIKRLALQGMTQLVHNPYWHRLWIVQEIGLASDLELFCGSKIMKLEELVTAIEDFRPLAQGNSRSQSFGANVLSIRELNDLRIEKAISIPPRLEKIDASPSISSKVPTDAHYELVCGLSQFNQCFCEDPRDKLFGLKSLLSDPSIINVDYDLPLADLFMEVIFACVAHLGEILWLFEKGNLWAWLRSIMKDFNLSDHEWLTAIQGTKLTYSTEGIVLEALWSSSERIYRVSNYRGTLTADGSSSGSYVASISAIEHFLEWYISQYTDQVDERSWRPVMLIELYKSGHMQVCAKSFSSIDRHLRFHCAPALFLLIALFEGDIPFDCTQEVAETLQTLPKLSKDACECGEYSNSSKTKLESHNLQADIAVDPDTYQERVSKYWNLVDDCQRYDWKNRGSCSRDLNERDIHLVSDAWKPLQDQRVSLEDLST